MRVLTCKAKNFASYKELDFDFSNRGLTLIHGATGSGKSTLCDLIPWCLFGRSAKNGTVGEVLSWPGESITSVEIGLDTGVVCRIRGANSKDNDLYFIPSGGIITRGKDLNDTQRLLNDYLGVDYDLYLASAYFHEFSQSAQFFTASAKTRRLICEQIVDLSLPKKLTEAVTEQNKPLLKKIDAMSNELARECSHGEIHIRHTEKMAKSSKEWETNKINELEALEKKRNNFDKDLQKEITRLIANKKKHEKDIQTLVDAPSDVCEHCGAPSLAFRENEKIEKHNQYLALHIGVIEQQLSRINTVNTYQESIDKLKVSQNPHISHLKESSNKVCESVDKQAVIGIAIADLHTKSSDYDVLSESLETMRSQLIEQAIRNIEDTTNNYLSTYFDAEIKVTFQVQDNDKLNVEILKDGNQCSYTQLSKGQRQLLKLCFGLSVMKQASNNSLVNFSQIFIDESLDGLDANFKVKAYNLLQELSTTYESVFVVEHSIEMKESFENKVLVRLVNGNSEVNYEN